LKILIYPKIIKKIKKKVREHMDFDKIITIVLIVFIVALLFIVFLPDIKDMMSSSNAPDQNQEIITPDTNKISGTDTSSINNSSGINIFGKDTIPVNVYFCPSDECESVLLDLIEDAKESIDCAVYDIDLVSIRQALVSAKEKGKSIRLVSDLGRSSKKNSQIGLLKSAGIAVILNDSEQSYMHNKFCVFDNKTILVGSMNFTLNDIYKNNNNYIVFENKDIAEQFTKKIDSFFQGNFSPSVSKDINYNKIKNIEFYFCPEDNCKFHFLEKLNDANVSIDCMFYSFTLDDATNVLKDKNVSKRFIFETNTIDEYSEYSKLIDLNIPVIKDKNAKNMHNKLCIIDNVLVITGSMNLSVNGTENNDETLIFVYDPEIAQEYTNYFNNYWFLWNDLNVS